MTIAVDLGRKATKQTNDQRLCFSLFGNYHIQTSYKRNFNFLAGLSVAEETGLKLALSETPKTGFLATRPI